MGRRRRLALAVLALAALSTACPLPFGPKELGIRVDDTEGFKPGVPVLLKGIEIGAVTEVVIEDGKPTILVRIDHGHRDDLRGGAVMGLRTPGLFSGSATHALIVEDAGQGEPLAADARIRAESPGGALLRQAGNALKGAADALEDAVGVAREAEGDARKLIDEAKEAAAEAGKAGADALERLRRETLPRLEKELKAFEESMRKAGKGEEADRLSKELQDLLK